MKNVKWRPCVWEHFWHSPCPHFASRGLFLRADTVARQQAVGGALMRVKERQAGGAPRPSPACLSERVSLRVALVLSRRKTRVGTQQNVRRTRCTVPGLSCSCVSVGTRKEEMSNWKPFVFGGLASVTAECGEMCVCSGHEGGTEGRSAPACLGLVLNCYNIGCDSYRWDNRCCSVFVAGTFPIDLAKTRLQVQGQVGDSKYREIRYRGMLHAMLRIGREEGLRALYSGSVGSFYTLHMCWDFCILLQTELLFK